MSDIIRVVRVYEFSGPRDVVERQINSSLQDGTYPSTDRPGFYCRNGLTIRVATLGAFPEVIGVIGDQPNASDQEADRSPSQPPSG